MTEMTKMQKVGIFVCSNGRGHLRRSLILAKAIASEFREVHVHCDLSKLSSIDEVKQLNPYVKYLMYTCNTSVTKRLDIEWWEKNSLYGKRYEYDVAISDNLMAVLSENKSKHKIISGHFLWEFMTSQASEYVQGCAAEMLMKENIYFAGSKLVTNKLIKSQKNYVACRIYGNKAYRYTKDAHLFITNGTTEVSNRPLFSLIIKLRVCQNIHTK